jgi:hypothetical protein
MAKCILFILTDFTKPFQIMFRGKPALFHRILKQWNFSPKKTNRKKCWLMARIEFTRKAKKNNWRTISRRFLFAANERLFFFSYVFIDLLATRTASSSKRA